MKSIKFTLLMILCNILIFMMYKEEMIGYWGIVVIDGRLRDAWTLLSYGFFHVKTRHLVLNLIFIFLLSGFYEFKKGWINTMYVYITSIIIGGVFYILLTERRIVITLGASGAWYGILGALLASGNILNKFEKILVLLIAILCFYDTFTATNVNVIAHVAAFINGVMIGIIFEGGKKWKKK